MIFDEEEGGMIFLLSQRQQKGKVLNTCYWRIYNIMTMAMMMILLHKSCKVFYLLMIMIFIDIIPNIFSCATKINFARLSLLCWLDSWPMHHEAAQLSTVEPVPAPVLIAAVALQWGGEADAAPCQNQWRHLSSTLTWKRNDDVFFFKRGMIVLMNIRFKLQPS